MTRHLNRDVIVTLAEGGRVDALEAEHARSCARCAREVSSLASVVSDLRDDKVPEPSPLFWQQLSARIGTAIAREAREPGNAPQASRERPGWRWWVSAASLSALVIALLVDIGSPPVRTSESRVDAIALGSALANEAAPADAWQVVADVVATLDEATADDELPELVPSAADRAVLDLTPEERAALVELLHEEIAGAAL